MTDLKEAKREAVIENDQELLIKKKWELSERQLKQAQAKPQHVEILGLNGLDFMIHCIVKYFVLLDFQRVYDLR